MQGIEPVSKLPPRNAYAKTGKEVRRMLSDFLGSGAELAEVTRDSDGAPLEQRRVTALRTHMYKIARKEGMPIRTFVRWDDETGTRKLYLGREQ